MRRINRHVIARHPAEASQALRPAPLMKPFSTHLNARPSHLPLLAVLWLLLAGRQPGAAQDIYSHFIGLTNFAGFSTTTNADGAVVFETPDLKWDAPWNELIASWNADAPAGTWLEVEARAKWPDHQSKYYVMGRWTRDNTPFPRASVPGQGDADGDVMEDTLGLARLANTAQLRVTLGGTSGTLPRLRFLGVSLCNTNVNSNLTPSDRAAWGKIIPTPERSQKGYPGASGWCSPTSLSMDLARWADVLHRPDLNHTVPETAAAVRDHGHGTGDWPFNTAFAGSHPGMRAYVTRFRDMSELEDWVAAGIPVIISARWDLLQDGRPEDLAGHLTVCCGFTPAGDPVINDPATNLQKKESVRRVYQRANVLRAWATSHNTVYLIYPGGWPIPPSQLGDW